MMQKLFKSWFALPFIAGVFTFIAVCEINFFFASFCYVTLFISLARNSPKQAFKTGLVFGFAIACPAFYWMIPGAERFTGNSVLYGIGVFILSAFFLSLFFGAAVYCFSKLKNKDEKLRGGITNALLAASVFTVAEALLMNVSAGFPWFDFHSAYAISGNEYAIQPASVFGVHILSFFVVGVNYLTSFCIVQRTWKRLLIPAGIIILYLFAGYLLQEHFSKSVASGKPFTIAVLAENIPPEMKWNDANGNMLAQRLLQLNKEAVPLHPDIILWSESAIPWTYRKDDDLVNEVLKITAPSHAVHIMGINTERTATEVYNSAYCLMPDGNIAGRYDKQYLLSLIENPVHGIIIPFFSSSGFLERNNAAHAAPLNTAFGKAGIMICNECTVPKSAYSAVQQGASFLCNMSNDGWFNDTYIVGMHYSNARLRAVETRKDIAVNCNNGFSGLIQASGNIAAQERSTQPFVKMIAVQPNNYVTLAVEYPLLFVYCCAAFILIIIINTKYLHNKKTARKMSKNTAF